MKKKNSAPQSNEAKKAPVEGVVAPPKKEKAPKAEKKVEEEPKVEEVPAPAAEPVVVEEAPVDPATY